MSLPFPGFEGTPSVAMADVNGDMILDLVVGTGPGTESQVVAYDGNDSSQGRFTAELARFNPFDAGFTGGVAVAGADIDGNALSDNIIVGTGAGVESQVKVFDSKLADEQRRRARGVLHLHPVSGFEVRCHPCHRDGRSSARAAKASSPHRAPEMRRRSRPSGTTCTRPPRGLRPTARYPSISASRIEPTMTSNFLAYDEGYRDGVSLSTGWVAGAEGGAKSIVTGQLRRPRYGPGVVERVPARRVSRSCTPTTPTITTPTSSTARSRRSSRSPRAVGVTVGTTSTTSGADLLVSGSGPDRAELQKLALARPDPAATTVAPKVIAALPPLAGLRDPAPLGGQ